jgi:DNA replication protein DnaC
MSAATISTELRQILRRLRLSPMLDTLPERLVLAQQQHLPHHDFLELILADELARRERMSATLRARAARLDPMMTLEAWDDTAAVTFDRQLWAELTTLRFVEACNNVLVLGPVGVGKTMLATALGHIACRRRISVISERADRLFKRLKAARLDQTHDAEMRPLAHVDLLLIDDFALQPYGSVETSDIYELIVERHQRGSTVITSNREPAEWIAQMADTLLAQSAIDRLQSAAYELVIEGESYRRRQKPQHARGHRAEPTGQAETVEEAAVSDERVTRVPTGRAQRRGTRPA